MNKYITIILAFLFVLNLNEAKTQPWMEKFVGVSNPKLQDVEAEFNNYWSDKDFKVKGSGWKPFKRYIEFWKSRVLPDGSFPDPSFQFNEYQKFNKLNNKNNSTQGAVSWTNIGPTTSPGGYAGIGRVNCVRVNPINGTIWAGTPGGGLWKSSDGGGNWTATTDNLTILQSSGVTDIAFNIQNYNVMYIGTGDDYGGNTKSVGVFKSTDAGVSWNETGLKFSVTNNITISRVMVQPNNPNLILVGASNGIHRSTDAGVNWTKLNAISIKDMEWRPNNPSTVYAVGGSKFYKSIDDGATWNEVTSGVPTNAQRLAIAVTAANSNYVYMIASNGSSGFLGFYKSTDAGVSFTTQSTTPNILGYEVDGSKTGGQGWYDLCIAANPSSANDVFIGGVNNWRSTDGGINWTINTFWYQYSTIPTVHADKHDLYFSGSTLYCGNDGGIYSTSDLGNSWNFISNGLPNSQFYKIGVSTITPATVIAGAQDNGTKFYKNSVWTDAIGGDGMDCLVDYSNSSIMYGSLYYGDISKTTNGGNTFNQINDANRDGNYDNITESGAWVTPFLLDPLVNATMYVGMKNIWKSINGGLNFSKLTNLSSTSNIDMIRIAPTNSNNIYYQNNGVLNYTTDSGINWAVITKPDNVSISDLSISSTDENKVWLVAGGYNAAKKVYFSTNLGVSWVNVSGNFPNVIVNCLLITNDGINNRIYCGTDVGVYYSDNNDGSWVSFNSGLPYVKITDLELQKHSSKIIAGTYGRGVWEINLPNVVPSPTQISPANLSINLNPTKTELLWSSIPGANSYDLMLSNNPDFSSTISVINLTVVSNTYSNLSFNKNYYWQVRANTINGAGSWSGSFTFKTMLISPTLKIPDNSTSNIDITGLFNWDAVPGATYYELVSSTMSNFSNSTSFGNISTNSKTYSNFDDTQDYYWKVKAKNSSNDTSDWSGAFKFTTMLSSPTQIYPSNGEMSLDTSKINFNWASIPKALNYSIKISTDSTFNNVVVNDNNVVSNTFQASNFKIFTKYYWEIRAVNGITNSLWSKVNTFRTKMESLNLISPTTNSQAIDKSNALLNWSKRESSLSYILQLSSSSSFKSSDIIKEQKGITDTNFTFSNLSFNSKYFWRVRGVNLTDSTNWTSYYDFTTMLKEPILVEPKNKTIDLPKIVKINWTKSDSTNAYLVQVSSSNSFVDLISTSTFTDTLGTLSNLNSNVKYFWRVKSLNTNSLNNSDWSSVFEFTTIKDITKTSLISPLNLSIKVPLGKIKLVWQKFDKATSYLVEISKNNSFTPALISTEVSTTDYDYLIQDNYILYYWRVKPKFENSSFDWSDVWNFKSAIGITLLNSPLNNVINQDTSGVLKLNVNSGAKEYFVLMSEKDDFSQNSNTFKSILTSFNYSGLKRETKYYWKAKAFFDNDTSAWSDVWNFTTKPISSYVELDETELNKFTINPNPVDNECEIFISFPINSEINLSLINTKGQEIKSILSNYNIINEFKLNLNTSQIASGIYYLKLTKGGKQKILKLDIIR